MTSSSLLREITLKFRHTRTAVNWVKWDEKAQEGTGADGVQAAAEEAVKGRPWRASVAEVLRAKGDRQLASLGRSQIIQVVIRLVFFWEPVDANKGFYQEGDLLVKDHSGRVAVGRKPGEVQWTSFLTVVEIRALGQELDGSYYCDPEKVKEIIFSFVSVNCFVSGASNKRNEQTPSVWQVKGFWHNWITVSQTHLLSTLRSGRRCSVINVILVFVS